MSAPVTGADNSQRTPKIVSPIKSNMHLILDDNIRTVGVMIEKLITNSNLHVRLPYIMKTDFNITVKLKQ